MRTGMIVNNTIGFTLSVKTFRKFITSTVIIRSLKPLACTQDCEVEAGAKALFCQVRAGAEPSKCAGSTTLPALDWA